MQEKLHYHLIGIGGSGMSAIAQILHERGDIVTGSDRQENDATRRLRAAGIKVAVGHSEINVNGAEVVIYSAAIPKDNPEYQVAREKGLVMLERPAMLGKLMEPYEHRVAISGTHGKTTTTSMLSVILDHAGLDASALIGGDVKSLGGNARLGNGSIIITEACEAFESFLHLYPSITAITNIDADHLDYYGSIERIEESFTQFISQLDEDGCLVACWDDMRVRKVLDGCGRRIIKFGFTDDVDLQAKDIDISVPEPTFSMVYCGKVLGEVKLGVPGEQNVMDSLAAAAVAFELGADFVSVKSGLAEFHGAGRRFEILFDGDVMVVDDYAHHPNEIKATLTGARNAYDKHIIAIFQPHLYSRTKLFLNEFADALAIADEVIVSPIYAAREKPIDGVSAESIIEKLKSSGFANVHYASDKDAIADELSSRIKAGDMALILGAGDIRAVGEKLASILSSRAAK